MLGLGIESSCDETSLAIIQDGKEVRSFVIYSQIADHAEYRGVVPELASRAHLEKINPLLETALREANIQISDLSYVSVSSHPGLMGSLLIGAQLARCIALTHQIPIVAVNHLEAHFAVIRLEEELPNFPLLAVLLSGGNSSIYLYHDFGKMEKIADTMDDALGEAFDKVSAILNLPYPGGPPVERLAKEYAETQEKEVASFFPKLLKDAPSDSLDFSFSGLKTAVMYHVQRQQLEIDARKICYDFQNSAFELVLRNVKKAVKKTGIRNIAFAGGVLANGTLRNEIETISKRESWRVFYPKKKIYCTDNGAMVACLGYYLFQKGHRSPIDFLVSPKPKIEAKL
ncbi:tRNA N6-adenosine threonylcarbamoyltransferase [Leptospira ryugenii]|uniref:tRNA N6-adenosine threonylcarbamoyltransferase n=1 Tax=Leptospira ryugenii TaxID=1917863 RepID=A0A2P2DY97_9LEPT|nr:tRNA (adenosine(37)-N6)-threonylcarbamoyltransferase complex transferase subunit TsaD [Leptospira ryugenii]GBF49598.1 tRNA N6-adenosine threonylcarbamoyltransferase [Leptospira ryugenii]